MACATTATATTGVACSAATTGMACNNSNNSNNSSKVSQPVNQCSLQSVQEFTAEAVELS